MLIQKINLYNTCTKKDISLAGKENVDKLEIDLKVNKRW